MKDLETGKQPEKAPGQPRAIMPPSAQPKAGTGGRKNLSDRIAHGGSPVRFLGQDGVALLKSTSEFTITLCLLRKKAIGWKRPSIKALRPYGRDGQGPGSPPTRDTLGMAGFRAPILAQAGEKADGHGLEKP